jgi:cell division protein FtsI/penicillin-binding protein 2
VSSTPSRIAVVRAGFGLGFVIVLAHLWLLMVHDRAVWARRSHENRWSFRSVPSQRGDIRDRLGRLLATDEPTMAVSLNYLRFRLWHPVGAAVHGAITLANQQPERAGTAYDYGTGALGPEVAARDLLAMPAALLKPRVLSKDVTAELQTAVTTVLAQGSGMPRAKVFAALREAARAGDGLAVGDVLPIPRRDLLLAFDQRMRELRELDQELHELHRARALAVGRDEDAPPGLLGTLERLRRASLTKERVTWEENGERKEGSLLESVRREFAQHVPFETAARLRIAADRHPGFEVEPSAARITAAAAGTPLRALLGNVMPIDRALPSVRWLMNHLATSLPADWLGEFVPEGLAAEEGGRASWQDDAAQRYLGELRRRERRGTNGIEAAFDATLGGRLGMRFIEADSKRREHRLWGNLEVAAGETVVLSLDLDLQQLAERVAAESCDTWRAAYRDSEPLPVQTALAVIDARTGDVLAYAAAPVTSSYAASLPGLTWSGNGSIGSVVKSMVLVEQLHAEATGQPHRPLAEFEGCDGRFLFRGTTLRCGHEHGRAALDPVHALATSCNDFFYQSGDGLGEAGMARALRRFGLLAPASADDPFAACWQPAVTGVPVVSPRVDAGELLPRRAIGYSVQCSPLHLARAYAVFATGALPTLGLLAGEARPAVVMNDVVGAIELVNKGLRACVTTGTGRHLPLLGELGVHGKTGTAEVMLAGNNNAWFAGFLPAPSADGVQLCFCAVVYLVPDKTHGGDAAGQMVVDFLDGVRADATLAARYLPAGGGR